MKQLLLLLLIGVSLLACTNVEVNEPNDRVVVYEDNGAEMQGKGRLVVAVTDAADMSAINELRLTIDNIELYSETTGWMSVAGDEETVDLLELRDNNEFLLMADVLVDAQTYEMVRVDLSSARVVDRNGEHDAEIPAEKFTIVGDVQVAEGDTTTLTLDFLADQSLHMTEQGDYLFVPVILVETRSGANVRVMNENVDITAGTVLVTETYSMDLDGEVDTGVQVPPTIVINIENGVMQAQDSETDMRVTSNTSGNSSGTSTNVTSNTTVVIG